MRISVIAPVSQAIERTQEILFRRFDFAKWITLGFCAWLAGIGEGTVPTRFGVRLPVGGGPVVPAPVAPPAQPKVVPKGAAQPAAPVDDTGFKEIVDWVQSNLEIVVGIGAAILLFGVLFSLLLTWLKARGVFMFLDGVVHDRGAVAEPWRQYAREGNSLFRFIFLFGIAVFLAFVAVGAVGVAVSWADIRAGRFGEGAVLTLIVGVPVLSLIGLSSGLVQVMLFDFVVPIMYVRRVGTLAAWGEFRRSILSGHVGTLILYVLFKIVLGIGLGLLAIVATCATCCIAGLPFIGTVILLPLPVFLRCYSLYFLEQFGADWRVFPSVQKGPQVILEDLPPPLT